MCASRPLVGGLDACKLLCVTTFPLSDAAPTPGLARRAYTEVRDTFPVWFNLALCIGHVLTALFLLWTPRYVALYTLAFPLFWIALYYNVRRTIVRLDPALVATLLVALPAAVLIAWWPAKLAYSATHEFSLKFGFELLSLAWVGALVLHCWKQRGPYYVVVFFVAGAVYGLALENSGISMGYFSETNYRMYVPLTHTPVSSVAGWCTIFYPSVFIAETLIQRTRLFGKGILASALLVSVIALSTDLHFDHLATLLNMWTWHPKLPPFFLGVPLVNFTSWLTAVFAYALAYFYLERLPWSARRKGIAILASVPAMLVIAAILNLALTGMLEGPSGPSWTIMRGFFAY